MLALGLALLLGGCLDDGGPKDLTEQDFEKAALTVKGNLTYRERIALPKGAQAEVLLTDATLDKPLAMDRVAVDGQVPIPFQLSMRAEDILKGHQYALSAHIQLADGTLVFHSKEDRLIDPFGLEIVTLRLYRTEP